MKKRISALAIVWILIVSISLASYASPRLNMNVFENAEDITVKYDDMSKATTISSTSLLKGKETFDLIMTTITYLSIQGLLQLLQQMNTHGTLTILQRTGCL